MDCKDQSEVAAPEAPGKPPVHVLAAVSDLIFVSKISAAAKQAGCPVEYYRNATKLQAAVPGQPVIVIVDLNNAGLDPIELIRALKENESTRSATVVAYLSHIQTELKREAEKAGADLVLPRSVFSQNLYDILRQHSCHL